MIYLDHAATTPLDPRAREAMLPWLDCANPSSQHAAGREARMAIDVAREFVAEAMRCLPGEVIFTSSGTEACVTAILGAARSNLGATPSDPSPANSSATLSGSSPAAPTATGITSSQRGRLGGGRNRILMGAVEHHAVLHCEKQLRELGYEVDLIPATKAGAIDVSRLEVTDDVLLVCAMHANNETGAITDVDAVVEKCKSAGALFFCDAVQSFGKLPLPDADLIAVSAHKVYGPKGVGALRIRAGVKIEPLMAGGGQEREMRGGTENVAAIAGFGAATTFWQIAREPTESPAPDGFLSRVADFLMPPLVENQHIPEIRMPVYPDDGGYHIVEARNRFIDEVRRLIPSVIFTAEGAPCLPTHANLRIPGVSAEVALINLDRLGIAASSGAACSSGSVEPSHVLIATGLTEAEAAEGLRFTFGRNNTERQAKKAAQCLADAVSAAKAR